MGPVSFDDAAITLTNENLSIDVRLVRWSVAGGDTSACGP